jgi:Na+/proline symporter
MLAAILASNLSSSLSASAAAVVNDFYLPWRKTTDQRGLLGLTRGLTVVFGALQIALGILAQRISAGGSTVVDAALTIAGFVFGLLLGAFALGVFTRRAGQVSALVGMAVGLGLLLFLHFVMPALTATPERLGGVRVAFPWLAVIGAGTTFFAGWMVSWFIPLRASEGALS